MISSKPSINLLALSQEKPLPLAFELATNVREMGEKCRCKRLLSSAPRLLMRKRCEATGQASAVISITPPRCRNGAVTWALGKRNRWHKVHNEPKSLLEGFKGTEGGFTWKERCKVDHSLLHRSDRTPVATRERVRLKKMPIWPQ